MTKGRNPFSFIKHLAPAQIMAFSVSSSVACIPLSIESVMATGLVPDSVTRFVIPLGSTVNMWVLPPFFYSISVFKSEFYVSSVLFKADRVGSNNVTDGTSLGFFVPTSDIELFKGTVVQFKSSAPTFGLPDTMACQLPSFRFSCYLLLLPLDQWERPQCQTLGKSFVCSVCIRFDN